MKKQFNTPILAQLQVAAEDVVMTSTPDAYNQNASSQPQLAPGRAGAPAATQSVKFE